MKNIRVDRILSEVKNGERLGFIQDYNGQQCLFYLLRTVIMGANVWKLVIEPTSEEPEIEVIEIGRTSKGITEQIAKSKASEILNEKGIVKDMSLYQFNWDGTL